MNKSLFLLAFYCILYHKATSQIEIIFNGSFELFHSCPINAGQVDSIIGWTLPSYGSSDYFNICATNTDITIPINTFGNEFPVEGDAYIGFSLYGEGVDYREYIQTKLILPTIANHLYKVSFYVSLGDNFNYAIKQIHWVLSESPISQDNYQTIKIEPSIIFQDDNYFTNKNGWVKYQLFYLADKEYSYLTIGNFYDDLNTKLWNLNDGSTYFNSYYFIDSISMIDYGELVIPNVFSPNNDGINDSIYLNWLNDSDYKIVIYNRWGDKIQELSSNNNNWNGEILNLHEKVISGVYYFVIYNHNNAQIKSGFIHVFN